jgi:hypothetical protein
VSAYVPVVKVIFIPTSKQFDIQFLRTTAKNVVFKNVVLWTENSH